VTLGDAASSVTEVSLRYALADGARAKEARARGDDDEATAAAATTDGDAWLRTATFHYERGKAPRVLRHEVRLADGDYAIEIELRAGEKRATIHRVGTLSGDSLVLDASRALAP
jgi:hypothetical protein